MLKCDFVRLRCSHGREVGNPPDGRADPGRETRRRVGDGAKEHVDDTDGAVACGDGEENAEEGEGKHISSLNSEV
jgi:hypothetical protein